MSIKANTKYNGIVAPGSQLYEMQTGAFGYKIRIECEDRPTSFVIWLAQKNCELARRYFDVFRVDREFLKHSSHIECCELSFATKEEEYNGRYSVKEVWIGKRSDPNLSRSAARFFSAAVEPAPGFEPRTY